MVDGLRFIQVACTNVRHIHTGVCALHASYVFIIGAKAREIIIHAGNIAQG